MSVSNVSSEPVQIQESPTVSLKDYIVEICKRHAFFIVEIPRIFAEIAFRSKFGGEKVFKGLEVPAKLEYLVFFMDDLKSTGKALIELPKRVIEVIQKKSSALSLLTPMRKTGAKVASLISGGADVQTFFKALGEGQAAFAGSSRISNLVKRFSIIPEQLGYVSSMAANANGIYEWYTGQLDSQKAAAIEKNSMKVELSRQKDVWDIAKNVTIFALSSMFFVTGLVGGAVPALLIIGCSGAIITSRMGSFKQELNMESLDRMGAAAKQVNQIVKS